MKKFLVFILFISCASFLHAQNLPFFEDIQAFKKQDSINFPPKNAILFIGSSSFTKWTDVQNYFPSYPIINRGFGGSTLPDVTRYADDIIFPYHPRQIVIYCGENDFAYSDTVSTRTVFQRFQQLFQTIRKKRKNIPVLYISMKPSPARWHLKDKMTEANTLIKTYLNKQKKTVFVNVWDKMLTEDGKSNPELFIEDSLHINAKGYAIWQMEIEPYLLK